MLFAIALFFAAPVGAEYLIGYDTSTGRPLVLLASLAIFGPLYGAPAVLIREVARRHGLRWPGILALAAAAGILQAGVIDQSMFSTSYRDIAYWDAMTEPTWIPALGLSASSTLNFVVGHAVFSFGIPIALVEAASRTPLVPWLRRAGLLVAVVLYLAAAALILTDTLKTERDHASAVQIAGALTVVVLLIGYAYTFGRRPVASRDRAVPRAGWVFAGGLVASLAVNLAPSTWAGFTLGATVLLAVAATVVRVGRSPRWSVRHVVALCTGALVGRAAIGFLVTPLGDDPVPWWAKYGHNTFFVAGCALLGWWLCRRAARHPCPAAAR